MLAWSPEIANELIRLAAQDGRAFNQLQLQKLVYVAHGWCLAITGQPLTGDRPEAWEYGPVYRRIADALAGAGCADVTEPISLEKSSHEVARQQTGYSIQSILDAEDSKSYAECKDYGWFEAFQLSALTRHQDAPWSKVFADGEGKFRDISHGMIRAQFVQLASRPVD